MLMLLSQSGCITQEQMKHLHDLHDDSKNRTENRNRALLDLLKRRSLYSYQQFINCLKQGKTNVIALRVLEHTEGK